MDGQLMFDTVVRHLMVQRVQSNTLVKTDCGTRQVCAYRGLDGGKCAIGALIPDEVYDQKMEGLIVDQIVSKYPVLEKYIPDLYVAYQLQRIHDMCKVNQWPIALWRMAKLNNFDPSAILEFEWAKNIIALDAQAKEPRPAQAQMFEGGSIDFFEIRDEFEKLVVESFEELNNVWVEDHKSIRGSQFVKTWFDEQVKIVMSSNYDYEEPHPSEIRQVELVT